MIRFRCPQCAKTIKVPDEKAGTAVRCPRCKERSVAPAQTSTATAGRTGSDSGSSDAEGPGRHTTSAGDEAPGLFSGMRRWEQGAVAVVAAVGIVSLLLPVVAPLIPGGEPVGVRATPWAVVLVPSALILLLVILHGHATGCPSCGRWWTRRKVESEFVGREVVDKGGIPFARSTYRTTYKCGSCGHGWSVDHADEYKDFLQGSPKRRLG